MQQSKVISQGLEKIYQEVHSYLCLINYEVIDRTDLLDVYESFFERKRVIQESISAIIETLKLQNKQSPVSLDPLFGVPLKKSHEIKCLVKHFDSFNSKVFVDIGGGKGHLVTHLFRHQKINQALTLDANLSYQQAGAKNLTTSEKQKITYLNHHVSLESLLELQALRSYQQNCTICGLHACGSLSEDIIQFSATRNVQEVLSIGCCYHKIKKFIPLSQMGKKFALPLSRYALNLANHSNQNFDPGKIQHKRSIRKYRYLINLYFLQKKGFHLTKIRDFRRAPETMDDYLNLCQDILSDLNFDRDEFFNFIQEDHVKKELEKILNLVEFRLVFGRIIEIYLILDRAQYLIENNYHVTITPLFHHHISPRNLLLHAQK